MSFSCRMAYSCLSDSHAFLMVIVRILYRVRVYFSILLFCEIYSGIIYYKHSVIHNNNFFRKISNTICYRFAGKDKWTRKVMRITPRLSFFSRCYVTITRNACQVWYKVCVCAYAAGVVVIFQKIKKNEISICFSRRHTHFCRTSVV